jgi:hypothetical protein
LATINLSHYVLLSTTSALLFPTVVRRRRKCQMLPPFGIVHSSSYRSRTVRYRVTMWRCVIYRVLEITRGRPEKHSKHEYRTAIPPEIEGRIILTYSYFTPGRRTLMSPPLLLPGGPRAAYALVCNLRSSLPSSV